MKTLVILTLVQLVSVFSFGYILPLDVILQKNAALAGNSIISVDQEVIFKDSYKEFVVKENWLIEGDRNLRLTARGAGELKDLVSIAAVYNNKNKTSISGKNRQSRPFGEDFFEKYLAIKSKESFQNYFKEMGISPNVRLSRAAGAVCFAVGDPPKTATSTPSPEVWFDQDSFRLAKMRFPGNAEVEFSDYAVYNNVHYPRKKLVTWGDKTVTIRVLKVSTKTSTTIKSFYPESLEQASEISVSRLGGMGASIEEFYKRFR